MIDLSQDACDARMLKELIFITQLAETVWDQDVWGITGFDRAHFYPDEETPCGTKGCLAGWAAVHAGLAHPDLEPMPPLELGDVTQFFLEINETGVELIRSSGLELPVGRFYGIKQDFFALGAVLFGLQSREAAQMLFRSNHTLGSLWSMATRLTAGRVALPDQLVERVRVVDVARYERARR